MKTALLFLNGNFCIKFCINYIKKFFPNEVIYCADGAINIVKNYPYLYNKIKLVIGDKDSIINNKINSKFKYNIINNQNLTDFDKSIKCIIKYKVKKIIVFGAEGGELDHYLSNISTIIKYSTVKIFLIDIQHISCLFPSNRFILNDMKNRNISILPLCKINNISIQGCKFNFNNINLKFGRKISVRNYGLDNQVKIQYSSGNGILFVSNKKNDFYDINSIQKIKY